MSFWKSGMRPAVAVLLGAAVIFTAAQGSVLGPGAEATAFEPKVEAVEDLPDGPGRDEAFYGCTACHAFNVVSRQSMDRDRWDGIIQEMVDKHSMAEPSPEDRKLMLDYLASTYPAKAPRSGWTNPFLK